MIYYGTVDVHSDNTCLDILGVFGKKVFSNRKAVSIPSNKEPSAICSVSG